MVDDEVEDIAAFRLDRHKLHLAALAYLLAGVVLPVAVSKAVALIGRGAYAKYLTVDAARKLEAKGDKCIIMGLK